MSMVYYSSTRLGQQAQRGDWKMLFFSSHIMQRSYSITIIHHTSFSAISTYSRALIVFKGPWSWLLFQPMMMILRFSTRSEASLEPSSSSTCIIWPFTWKRGWSSGRRRRRVDVGTLSFHVIILLFFWWNHHLSARPRFKDPPHFMILHTVWWLLYSSTKCRGCKGWGWGILGVWKGYYYLLSKLKKR